MDNLHISSSTVIADNFLYHLSIYFNKIRIIILKILCHTIMYNNYNNCNNNYY